MKNIFLALLTSTTYLAGQSAYQVKPLTEAQAREYKLDTGFYKKATVVQDILIATSAKVATWWPAASHPGTVGVRRIAGLQATLLQSP